MKKYINRFTTILLLSMAVAFFMPSCHDNDFLEETPYDFLSPDNAYSTVSGIRQGVVGLYELYRAKYWWDSQTHGCVLRGLGTDVAFHGENPGNSALFLNDYVNMCTPTDGNMDDFWIDAYLVIQRANVVIDKCEKADESIWETEGQKEMFIGEAKFFRAYLYHNLVSDYGAVPLILEAISEVKTDLTRTPVDEVYKQIIEDLEYAAQYLPKRGEEEASGRVTKAAAYHCMAEAYLNWNKWDLAEAACDKILDGTCGNYALVTERFGTHNDVFGSGDCWIDLFTYGNQNIDVNTETIWAVQFEPLITGGDAWEGERAFGPAYHRWGSDPSGKPAWKGVGVGIGYSDTLGRPVSWIHPTDYAAYQVWASDWDNDIRNAEHAIKRTFYYENPESEWNGKQWKYTDYMHDPTRPPSDSLIIDGKKVCNYMRPSLQNDTCQYIYPYYMKFASPCLRFDQPQKSGNGWTHQDVYQMRLAETYLFRAEARYMQGNIPGAANDINVIRERAKATPVEEADVNLEYILDERCRELYGEEKRFQTLRRHNLLVERVKLYNNNPVYPGCRIQDYHNLFPIPQTEIDLNINGDLKQNPGYPQ